MVPDALLILSSRCEWIETLREFLAFYDQNGPSWTSAGQEKGLGRPEVNVVCALDVNSVSKIIINFIVKGKEGLSLLKIYPQSKTHQKRTQIKLYTFFGRTCKVTTPNWRRQDAAWQGRAAASEKARNVFSKRSSAEQFCTTATTFQHGVEKISQVCSLHSTGISAYTQPTPHLVTL